MNRIHVGKFDELSIPCKTKKIMAKIIRAKNPLAVCWGIVLRNTRESRSWEYVDIERMSGISPDFYRNIEKAIFNLHVSQALPLYKTFKSEAIGSPFTLDGIIQILSVISIMETRANEIRKHEKVEEIGLSVYYLAATELADQSKKIGKLLRKFIEADLFSADYDIELVSEEIIRRELHYELQDFLVHYHDYGELEKGEMEYGQDFFDDVPSIYTEFLAEMKKNLLSLPVRMIFSELQKWEVKNDTKIKELFVLIIAKFDVTEVSNLEKYHYTYLFQRNFERARFLIVDEKLRGRNLEMEFESNLKDAYKNIGKKLPKNWDKGLEKIRFKVIDSLTEELKSILTFKDEHGGISQYEAFWVFKFIDETLVGFVANAEEAEDFEDSHRYVFVEGRSLFIKDLLPRYPTLKSYLS